MVPEAAGDEGLTLETVPVVAVVSEKWWLLCNRIRIRSELENFLLLLEILIYGII